MCRRNERERNACLHAGNYKSLAEIVTGTLETDFDVSARTVKLASGDEHSVTFAPVAWAENKAIWKVREWNASTE